MPLHPFRYLLYWYNTSGRQDYKYLLVLPRFAIALRSSIYYLYFQLICSHFTKNTYVSSSPQAPACHDWNSSRPSLSAKVYSAKLPLPTREQTETPIIKLSQIITESAIKNKKKVDRTTSHPTKMPWLNDELAYHRQRIRNAFRKWCKCKNSSSATRFQIDNLRMLYKKEAINFQRIIRKEKWKSGKASAPMIWTAISSLLSANWWKKKKISENPSSLFVNGKILKSPFDISKHFQPLF